MVFCVSDGNKLFQSGEWKSYVLFNARKLWGPLSFGWTFFYHRKKRSGTYLPTFNIYSLRIPSLLSHEPLISFSYDILLLSILIPDKVYFTYSYSHSWRPFVRELIITMLKTLWQVREQNGVKFVIAQNMIIVMYVYLRTW